MISAPNIRPESLKHRIVRVWNGNLGLGQAFWGVGLGGLFLVLLGLNVALYIAEQMVASHPYMGIITTGIVAAIYAVYAFQTVAIWRASNKSSAKYWRRAVKTVILFSWGVAPFVVLLLWTLFSQFEGRTG